MGKNLKFKVARVEKDLTQKALADAGVRTFFWTA